MRVERERVARDRDVCVCVYGSYTGRTVGVNISSNASAPNDAFQYVVRVYNRFYRNILARMDINTPDRPSAPLSSSLRFFFFFFLLSFFLVSSRWVYELIREASVTIGGDGMTADPFSDRPISSYLCIIFYQVLLKFRL